MIENYLSEILQITTAIIVTSLAWFFGGKQTSKRKTENTLTQGADQIVDTSQKLIETLDRYLSESRIREKKERMHKETCEKSLKEHKIQINKLHRKVAKLEKFLK